MIEWRPYQTEIIDNVFRDWQDHNNLLVVAATGAGKTNVLWGVADRFLNENPGARVMVMAHRKELIDQPLARLEQFWPGRAMSAGIVMGETNDCHRRIVIATVQTVGHKNGKRLAEVLSYGKIDLLITDECFVAGTLVDGKPIEEIKVGDKVTAFDEQSKTFVQSRVTRLFKNPAPATLIKIVANGNEIICTPDHPVWCNGEWLPAKFVTSGDSMVQYTTCNQVVTSSRGEGTNGLQEVYQAQSVCGVRQDVYSQQLEFKNDTHLLGGMQTDSQGGTAQGGNHALLGVRQGSGVQGEYWVGQGQARHCLLFGKVQEGSKNQNIIRGYGEYQSQVCQQAHEGKQPDVRSGCKREDANEDASAWLHGQAGGKWGINTATRGVSQCSGMANRSHDSNRSLSRRQWLSICLQGGHRQRNFEGCHRGGRQGSQVARPQRTGSKENGTARIVRVDSIEILERGSDKRFDRLCPDGFVYNLEVEEQHTYIANNLVVHNCHHVSAKSYQQVIATLKAANPELKHLGVTATPERGDRKSLAATYERESANVGVLRLIEEGFLCEPKVHGVKTSIDLSWVSVHGAGGNRDYNQQQLVAAVETSECFDLVVKTHLEKVGDRPTIAFVPSVAGAHRLAQLLQAKGISAIAADATTPKDERAQMLRDFRAGRYTALVNCALWTEGLDLPSLECCHLVRPTKSDSLYLQMVGRVLRTYEGKAFADIFDYQPVGERNLEQRMEDLGLKKPRPNKFAHRGGGAGADDSVLHKAGDHLEYVMLDYFKKRKEAWIDVNGWRIVGLGKGADNIERSMAVSPDGCQLWAIWRKEGERWNQAKPYLTADFETVAKKADEFAHKYGSKMISAKAPWRKGPPSEKMAQFGQRLKVYQSHMTAGQLSDAINQKLVMQAIQRSGEMKAAA